MAGAATNSRLIGASTSKARFSVATANDNAAIRRLLRENPMPGAISLSLEREPDYFRGADIGGAEDETILVSERDKLVCMGRCSLRTSWINGAPQRVGYLAELRLDASAQGRFDLLRRGYRYFQELHESDPPRCYFTSIAADNDRARRLFESGRKGLPTYEFLGEFVTLLVAVPRRAMTGKLRVEVGAPERVEEMADVLNQQAKAQQLAAVWTAASLRSLAKHGLPLDRFQLVLEGGKIIACGALWDQRAFRQTVIRSYSFSLSTARPLINLAAQLFGTPHLPSVDTTLSHAFLSPLGFEAGRESILADFVESFFPSATRLRLEFLTLGMPAQDPRLNSLRRRFSTRAYHSRLYRVSWPGGVSAPLKQASAFPDVALL